MPGPFLFIQENITIFFSRHYSIESIGDPALIDPFSMVCARRNTNESSDVRPFIFG